MRNPLTLFRFLAAALVAAVLPHVSAQPAPGQVQSVQANNSTGALVSPSAFSKNLVPSMAGQSGKLLGTDGTTAAWQAAGSGSGTVTSVAVTGANGIGVSGSPITAGGTIALSLGAITPTTVNALTFLANSTGFTISGGTTSKSLTVNNTLTLSGTDGSTLNVGTGGTLGTGAYFDTAALNSAATANTYLRDWDRARLRLSGGVSSTAATIAVLGDSWSSLASGNWLTYADPHLKTVLGDAGAGYVSFDGTGPARPANATVTRTSWTITSSTGRGLNRTEVNSSTVGARVTVALTAGQTAAAPVLHYLKKSGGGDLRYSFDSGGTWTTIATSNASDLYSTQALTVPGSTQGGNWTLWLEVLNAGSGCTAFGVDVADSNVGARVHVLAYPGFKAADYSGATAALWQAGFAALNPDLTIIGPLATNDQDNTSTTTFATNLTTIITNIRTAKPGAAIMLVIPANNLRTNSIPMSDYAAATQTVASTNSCAFVNLVADWGSTSSYDGAAPRILMLAADNIHPTTPLGYQQVAANIIGRILPDGKSIPAKNFYGALSQSPAPMAGTSGHAHLNARNFVATVNLNPGFEVYNGTMGGHLGYSGGYRYRLFSPTGLPIVFAWNSGSEPTAQASFTEWFRFFDTATGYQQILSTLEATTGAAGSFTTAGGIYASKKIISATDGIFGGLLTVGSSSTVHTDAAGKILTAALNTVGVAQGGTGAVTLTGIVRGNGTSAMTAAELSGDVTTSGSNVTTLATVTVAKGGTGLTTTTSGGLLYSSATAVIASSAALTSNAFLTGGGAGAAPNAVALTGIVKGNGASAPTAVTAPSGAIVGTTDTQSLFAKQVLVTAAHGTDDTWEGMAITGLNAGATIAQWEAVYLPSGGTYQLADCNGSGTYPAIGVAVAAYSNGNGAQILTRGTVRNDSWNWVIGGRIYLSGTAGALTQTLPSTSGDKVQDVGFALTADIACLDFNGVYVTVQ